MVKNFRILIFFIAILKWHIPISDGINDITVLHSLRNLASLIISGKSKAIDLDIPKLVQLAADWSSLFSNPVTDVPPATYPFPDLEVSAP